MNIDRTILAGALGGLFAVMSWGASFALVRAGTNQGLHAVDFVFLRYGVAGLIAAPALVFLWRDVRRIGFWKGLALTAAAGPIFFFLGSSGFVYAPLAHGAIIQPSTVAIGGLLLGAFLFGETLTVRKLSGVAAIIAGIMLVGGSSLMIGNGQTWIGDLLFAAAGSFWLMFTLLVRRWRIDPIAGTILVSVASATIVVPYYLVFVRPDRLAAIPMVSIATQVLVQGFVAGIIATACFSYSIRQLGVGRAAMFPAMVPTATVLIGIPLANEWPTIIQVFGLVMASLGLALAILGPTSDLRKPSSTLS
ncbi:DMT family transporter [Tardiphaga sp. 1201_B9_N1_1]|uniref:DMT family transporter n=1 Tax=unclassified Tardiphaga TaxID=2631404 RepID=UPI003F26CC0C